VPNSVVSVPPACGDALLEVLEPLLPHAASAIASRIEAAPRKADLVDVIRSLTASTYSIIQAVHGMRRDGL